MSTQNLPLIPGTLPAGWCPTGPTALQDLYNMMFQLGYAQFSTGTGWVIKVSDTQPSADEQSNTVWIQTSANAPVGIFIWSPAGGTWAWPACRSSKEGDERRLLAVATEAEIWAYDGGSGDNPTAVIPTAYSGAMWERDTDFQARTIIGVGTDGTYTYAANTNYGTRVSGAYITADMLPEHKHAIGVEASGYSGTSQEGFLRTGGGEEISFLLGAGNRIGYTELAGRPSGTQTPVPLDNLTPCRALYIIKRTIRRFYTP